MIRSGAYWLIIVPALVLASCTGMKNIAVTDPLYLGHEITFTARSAENKKLVPVVKDVLKPIPNNKLLWMRPALARYNMLSPKARAKKFWKSKIAPPVLLSQTKADQISTAIHNRMFHNGYFNNTVEFDTINVSPRKTRLRYKITLHAPYRFKSILFPEPNNDLTQKIHDSQAASLLRTGDIYTLEAVKNERIRIDRDLKEKGYFYFNPDFISLKADSVTDDHSIKAEVTVKPETPPESRVPYTIGKVFIHDDHTLENSSTDTLQFDNYYLISPNKELSFNALQKGIFLKPGERYANANYLHTIRYLNELPIIRNATLKFSPTKNKGELDAVLYLSQRKRIAYTAEFNTIFRSTNYFGPGVIFSYTDRNAKKGAEMLKVNLRGRFEMQISDGDINPAYEVGLEVNYTLPRFFPKVLFEIGKKSLPKTNVSVGYNLFNRLDLYRMNSVFTNFGYLWSKNANTNHSFNPVEIIFTKIPESSKSEEFNTYLSENPGVQRSFDEQLISGLGYEFTYSPSTSRNALFLRAGIDMAGNLLNGLFTATNATKDSLGRYKLLGVPFSQYMRTKIDIRYSLNFNQRSKLVTRFIAGVGFPFGNSDILPYIKQFYVGGTNSLRSFVARSVGPGNKTPPEGYNDLTGDIRLECNLEYRFDIYGKLKGALFTDAGNIWLFNDDESKPDGAFHINTFLDEIAISSGWGLRWDFDFIVARLDFAYTLRTPYLPAGERWATDFQFWNPTVNIAIGYPF